MPKTATQKIESKFIPESPIKIGWARNYSHVYLCTITECVHMKASDGRLGATPVNQTEKDNAGNDALAKRLKRELRTKRRPEVI